MQGKGSCAGLQAGSRLGAAREDDVVQFGLLTLVLSLHPAQLTAGELAREMSEAPEDPGERDKIARAVRDLVGAGLLRRNGELILATRPAVRFHQLVDS